jgi:hypothetical protein
MPNQHDAIDNAGQKQGNISAVGDLHEIREKKLASKQRKAPASAPVASRPHPQHGVFPGTHALGFAELDVSPSYLNPEM